MTRVRQVELPALYLTTFEEDMLRLLNGRELYTMEIAQAFKDVHYQQKNAEKHNVHWLLKKLAKMGLLSARSIWSITEPHNKRNRQYRDYYTTTSLGADALQEADYRRQALTRWPQPLLGYDAVRRKATRHRIKTVAEHQHANGT